MKLVLYFFSLRSAGGAERTLIALASEMQRRGHQVQLVSWDDADARAFHPIPGGLSWSRLGKSGERLVKLRRTTRLLGLLRRERPDLFVGFVMGADKSVYFANAIARVPVVAAERSAPAMYRARLSAAKARFYFNLFALCRGVVVQFDSYRSGYPARIRRRIAAIPNAVSTPSSFARPGMSGPRNVLLAVGRFTDEKRFEVLIDAFHLLVGRYPGWDLRVVGNGVNRGALETRVRELKLEGRATICPAASDIDAEYARAQLFVLPSRWEGFPNALAEAMAHGLPAVGFASCPGVNELVVPGSNGWLAPDAGDAKLSVALADTLAVAMQDAETRRAMGERARESMRAYAPQSVYDRWEAVLEEWARPSGRVSPGQ